MFNIQEVPFRLLEAIDSSKSLAVSIALRYQDLDALTSISISPIDYLDPGSYLDDAQAIAVYKKNPWISLPTVDTAAVALSKFYDSEVLCSKTNLRFKSSDRSHMRSIDPYIHTARLYATRILGPVKIGSINFGPGSTSACKGSSSDYISKLATKPECTSLAFHSVIWNILDQIPHYALSCGILSRDRGSVWLEDTRINIIKGNRFTTVPKDWRTDRSICIEPHGNMLIQKGYGDSIRSRLKKFGLDLNNLPEAHGEYARLGSIDGSFATIDLSSASDTIAIEFVKAVLPTDWFDALNSVRSHKTLMPSGEWMVNEKFSSMGNGFTFELETLLFYCLSLAVKQIDGNAKDVVSVFGDDIIVSSNLSNSLIALLKKCGFQLNLDKTFVDGPFRESCGQDYFLGKPVRPTYFKELPDDGLLRRFTLANRISDTSSAANLGFCRDRRFFDCWMYVVSSIPKSDRLYGPSYLGDSVILNGMSFWASYKNGCLRVKVISKVYSRKKFPNKTNLSLACALYGLSSSGIVTRSAHVRLKQRYVHTRVECESALLWL